MRAEVKVHLPLLLVLIVGTIGVYGQLLGHDFLMNWDDNTYVTANGSVHGFSPENIRAVFTSYYAGNYAPVQMLSYMLDYTVWGLWPGGYLLTNVVLHTLNGLLVYWLLFRLHGQRLLATVAAGIFLLHPVQVESVAWISQRKNLLAMLFMLVAWLLYCRSRESAGWKRRACYAASLAGFLFSLLAKAATVFFPCALLLYELCFVSGARRGRCLRLLPFFSLSVVVSLVTLLSQSADVSGWSGIDHGGRAGWHGGSPWATFLTMLPVFCTYLRLLLWPSGLSAIYDPPIHTAVDPTVLGCAVLLLLVAMLAWRLCRPDRRLWFWLLFIILAILPVAQLVPLITLMNDRYLYFPMIGAAALAGAGSAYLRDARSGKFASFVTSLALLLGVLLAAASLQRVGVWQNSRTLWRDAAAKVPARFDVWEGLGEAYHLSLPVEPDNALRAYRRAFSLYSSNPNNLYNLATLYAQVKDQARAELLLHRLLRLKPEHVMGWAALGDIHLGRAEYREAEYAYRRAESLQPDALQVAGKLGELFLRSGNLAKARLYYGRLEQGAGDAEAAFGLARIEATAGRLSESMIWLEKSLQRGYSDGANLQAEKSLAVVRKDPRFDYLLARYFH